MSSRITVTNKHDCPFSWTTGEFTHCTVLELEDEDGAPCECLGPDDVDCAIGHEQVIVERKKSQTAGYWDAIRGGKR